MRNTAYRFPNERLVLALTLFLVFGVIAASAVATVCGSLLFIGLYVMLSYSYSRSHHQELMRKAYAVSPQNQPELAEIIHRTVDRLQPDPVNVYILPIKQMNAYTFGLSSPKVVVFYAGLFETMDADEIAFVLGHELGHVALGHTWLNSLVGGIAGIPSSWGAAIVMSVAFLWWNRMCEYSADRAGLLACGKPEKAITALVKLAAGPEADTRAELEAAYRKIDAEDDTFLGTLNEVMATHPLLIRRIEQLRKYIRTGEYQRLQAQVNRIA